MFLNEVLMKGDVAEAERIAERLGQDVLRYMRNPATFSIDTVEGAVRSSARWGRTALRHRRWLGLDRQPVFHVTTDCEVEVEMLKGALEMSNRYPEPRIG